MSSRSRRAVLNLRDVRPIWAIPPDAADAIVAAFPADWEVTIVAAAVDGRGDGSGVTKEAMLAARGSEVYLGFGLPRELFIAMTASGGARLRWAHTGTAGVGSLLYPELRSSDIILTNSAGIHAPAIAETALAMMLHFARGLDHAVRSQARGEWQPGPFEASRTVARELAGATLGLLGLGGIGSELARRAHALGMTVTAVRRTDAPGPPGVRVLHGDGGFDTLLHQSDYLVVTVPGTAQTRSMIGAAELARMKPDAVIVNVARGEIIDEDALVAAIRGNRLRGAALDVFRNEPLPRSSPLWSLPNVLITPHVSATTARFWERETELIVDNVARYLEDRPLRNVVDKTHGY